MPLWIALVAAYLIGSVDFAVLVARMRGIDIHAVGSGNPGTSNVLRTLGRGPAAAVLVGDLSKGLVAAAWGWMAQGGSLPNVPAAAAAGFLAVVGHCYPIFHRFKGGKGVATGSGVIWFISPVVALVLTVVWTAAVRLTKVASVGSLAVVVLSLPLLWWLGGVRGWTLIWIALSLVLIAWRHRGNIGRLLKGREGRVPA